MSARWGVTPRGRLLLTAGAATAAQVWDALSRRQLARTEHPGRVNTVSFAPPACGRTNPA